MARLDVGVNDLATVNSDLAAEWHPTRNGDLLPSQVTAGSSKKVWWLCGKGHEWAAVIGSRSKGRGCPACAGRVVVPGANDLATVSLDLTAEWHPTKNGDLLPSQVTAGSNKKVWWLCGACGHEWAALVNDRSYGKGCPACAGRVIMPGANDLATVNLDLAAEWHPTKNGDLLPSQVMPMSNKKAWWLCGKGHEWAAQIASRSIGKACPACAGKAVSPDFNDLATVNPDLAAQWHPTKNGHLLPSHVTAGSDKKVWWLCSKGHEWAAQIAGRSSGNGCRACAGQVAVPGVNDLATVGPDLAAEWHPTKNGDLLPSLVMPGSQKKVWWLCGACGHEWAALVGDRSAGRGCRVCAGQVAVPGVNDLATIDPDLAAEWHPIKNGDLLPSQVMPGSSKTVWWLCGKCGDTYEMQLRYRSRGFGCACALTRNTTRRLRHLAEALLNEPEQLTEAARYLLVVTNGVGANSPFAQAATSADKDALRHLVNAAPATAVGGADQNDPAETAETDDDAVSESTVGAADIVLAAEDATKTIADEPSTQAVEPDQASRTVLPAYTLPSHMLPSGKLVGYLGDAQQLEFHITEAVSRWWRVMLQLDDSGDTQQIEAWLADARAQDHNPFARAVRDRFLSEYEAAQSLVPPDGWSFRPTPDAPVTAPNLMQRHAATLVARTRQAGNWSGTGTGKTVSAVLASRVVGADLTVVFCPNNTVGSWAATIVNCYPDARVATKTFDPQWGPGTGPRWLVINYDMLPNNPSAMAVFARREQIDFLVIDELHWLKIRAAIPASKRRDVLENVRMMLRPDACVLGMSATPVVNDLREGKSLIDLIEGADTALNVGLTVSNAVAMYERMCRIGFRSTVAPHVGLTRHEIPVDVSAAVPDLLASPQSHMDAVLVPYFYDLIVQEAFDARARGKGVLVYTHYLRNLLEPLRARLSAQGLRVATFTGAEDKADISRLRADRIDVLIGSSAVGTGVDGVQHWADTLIFAALPWTNAEFEQIQGRVHRQGSTAGSVRVVIPMAHIPDSHRPWNYTSVRLSRITRKRTLADAVVNGTIPTSLQPPVEKVQQALKDMLVRLAQERGITAPVEPPLAPAPLEPVTANPAHWHASEFSRMGARWSNTDSARTHERLSRDPQEWHDYHARYRAARTQWASVPAQTIADRLARITRPRRIADLGCGEMLLAQHLQGSPHEVIGFDHVAVSDDVIVADIANVPAPDGDFDVVVLSLALMGSNYEDYLEEAWRLLAADGTLYLAEPSRRLPADHDLLQAAMATRGFSVTSVSSDGKFSVLTATRSGAPVEQKVPLLGAGDLAVSA